MKQLILGIVFVVLIIAGMVSAQDIPSSVSTSINASDNWTMNPEASLAVENTNLADIRCVENVYHYLKTGNESVKKEIMNAMYDYDGTIGTWLTTIDNSTKFNSKAAKDRATSFETWNELNWTLIDILSIPDVNTTIDTNRISTFENISWNHLNAFETLMKYVDDKSADPKRSQIPLNLILMKSLITPYAYEQTHNPQEKEIFTAAMNSFDDRMDTYQARFPDVSTQDLISLKNDIDITVSELFTQLDAGKNISDSPEYQKLQVLSQKVRALDSVIGK